MSDLKTNSMPFGVGGPAEPMIESGAPGLLAGILNIPKNLIDKAAQFDPSDIHGSTGRVAPAAAEMALALAGGGAPMAEKGTAGIFGGKLAKTADLKALHEAEQMQAGGKHPADIWGDTGWMQSPMDSKWRFEIPDNKMALKYMPPAQGDRAIGSVDSLVSHPDLKKAYPQLFDANMEITRDAARPQGAGRYSPEYPLMPSRDKPKIEVLAPHMQAGRSVAAHELGHGVQAIEGFTFGTEPSQFAKVLEEGMRKAGSKAYDFNEVEKRAQDMYRRTAGEVEPRNIQARLDFSPFERKLRPPWETQDVPYDKQLLIEALKNYK